MAGSYNHVLSGWSLIENMGDARECVEELLWLVERRIGVVEARQLLDSVGVANRGVSGAVDSDAVVKSMKGKS